jgi:hypothetical protein
MSIAVAAKGTAPALLMSIAVAAKGTAQAPLMSITVAAEEAASALLRSGTSDISAPDGIRPGLKGDGLGWHILSYHSNDWSNYIYIYVWPKE